MCGGYCSRKDRDRDCRMGLCKGEEDCPVLGKGRKDTYILSLS